MLNANNLFVALPTYVAYYMHLDRPNIISKLRYRFKDYSIVYGIRLQTTGQLYIGSTNMPQVRFQNHLVTGDMSNAALQAAITKYGLSRFVAYVFEVVEYRSGLSKLEQRGVEQRYINLFPKAQLFNTINSSSL